MKVSGEGGDDRIAADSVCIAAGAWSGTMLARLGVATGMMPVRGQMVMFHCGRRPFSRILNEGSRYLVPRDDGRVLAGST
ncbi:FAD-dependent oxidoreductase, partial [Klebsiella pneumoniae]|uniref:FAD-dependent oxidoreductase n=1 Tax=Klebsiella pneumoniae TaxID=573 RepID=UPI0034D5571D